MAEKQDKLPEEVPANSKEAMIYALEKTMGIVTSASKLSGVSRRTHYFWMKEDAAYAEKCEEVTNIALDFAESKLHQLIQKGNVAAVLFFLKTKGKDRGYIERHEFTKKNFHVKLNREPTD